MFSPLTKELIEALRCLPGIGPKSAQRMAFYLLAEASQAPGLALADALSKALSLVKHCAHCRLYTENDLCDICNNPKRNTSLMCIVENPADALAIEQTHNYNGVYFILQGHLSPLDGVGPDAIGIPALLDRLKNTSVDEVILATNPTMEGEATAHYIASLLAEQKIQCSRIAHGVPVGGELEYLDSNTLNHAFQSRVSLGEPTTEKV